MTRASFAGVRPRERRTSSARGTFDVDEHVRELEVVEGHRLGGDVEVEPVRDDEAVDDVEVGRIPAVHARDDSALDDELRLRVVRPVRRDESELRDTARRAARRCRSRVARDAKRSLGIGEEPPLARTRRRPRGRTLPSSRRP